MNLYLKLTLKYLIFNLYLKHQKFILNERKIPTIVYMIQ